MMGEVVIFEDLCDAGFGVGRLGNVVLGMWLGDVTDARIDCWMGGLGRVAEETQWRFSVVLTICESSSPPKRQQRKRLTDGLSRYINAEGCFATVIEAGGLSGAVTRTIIHAMSALFSQPIPREVFKDTRDAAPWVVETSARRGLEVPSEAEIRAGIERLRAACRAM